MHRTEWSLIFGCMSSITSFLFDYNLYPCTYAVAFFLDETVVATAVAMQVTAVLETPQVLADEAGR